MRTLLSSLVLSLFCISVLAAPPPEGKKLAPQYADGAMAFHDRLLLHLSVLPPDCYKTCMRGIVVVRFRVKEDGTIDSLETRHSVDKVLDQYAYSFIFQTNGKWKPGEIDGKVAPMWKTLAFPYTVATTNAKPTHIALSGIRINEQVRLKVQNCPDGDHFYKEGVQAFKKGDYNLAWIHFNEANKRDLIYLDAIDMLKETSDLLGKPCDVCTKLSLIWELSEYEIKRVRDKYCTKDFKPLDAARHTNRIYDKVSKMPWPNFNTEAFAAANLQYPQPSKANCSQGTVLTRFAVMADGSIDSATTAFSVDPDLDAEAIRIIKKTAGMWEPGKVDGVSVNVYRTMPVKFTLSDNGCKTADWYYKEGERLYEQDQLSDALSHFSQAFKMDYTNHQAGYNYAAVAISLGKTEEGCKVIRHLTGAGFKDAIDLGQQYCK